jgi:hypothetical protein
MHQGDVISPDLGIQASTGTMKRKRSEEPVEQNPVKRQTDTSTTSIARSNALCDMLREYGMLEVVVSSLCAADFLALALTSKALHDAIMPRSTALVGASLSGTDATRSPNGSTTAIVPSGPGVEARHQVTTSKSCLV